MLHDKIVLPHSLSKRNIMKSTHIYYIDAKTDIPKPQYMSDILET